jgi:hypothetical protein
MTTRGLRHRDPRCGKRDLTVPAQQSHGWVAMEIDTRFLRLTKPAALGDRIDGWRVCWIGGKYHRTQRTMTMSSKCRPRNRAGRFWVTESPYQISLPALQQNPLH